jgi:AcrR family transcriptional regulator
MPAKTERRHRQGNESRRRILDAAIAIAVERGYDGTTVALVTERAELPASSVYWQFKNKDELIAEALDHSYRRWRIEGPTWQPANYSGTPRERIRTRLGHSMNSVERELDYWRLGLTLALLRRPGGIAAQDRFVAVRGETRRIIAEWWSSLDLAVAEQQPALVRGLTALYLAFVDGMFVAHRADPDIDLVLLEGVVAEAMADVYEARASRPAPPRRRPSRRRNRSNAPTRIDEDSRTRLLDAAAEIAAERGYRGTTISRVCARAQLPVSSVYWFFADKDDLICDVVQHSWEQWLAAQPRWDPPSAGTSWTEALTEILDGSVTSLTDAPTFLRIGHMLMLEQPPGEIAARDRFLQIRRGTEDAIRSWFEASLPRDAVAVQPLLPHALALALIAFTDGYFLGVQIDDNEPAVTEFVDLVVDVLAAATTRTTTQGD